MNVSLEHTALNKQVRIYELALTHLTSIIYLILMTFLPSRLL